MREPDPSEDAPLFAFASGKPVVISDAAKARGSRVFFNTGVLDDDEDDNDDELPARDARSPSRPPQMPEGDFPLIQFASGKPVTTASAAAKARAASVLADVDSDEDGDSGRVSPASSPTPKMPGGDAPLFTFASGRSVVVSEAAKARAAKVIGSLADDDDDDDDDNDDHDDGAPFIQFASGKPVVVSEDARERASRRFTALDEEDEDAGFQPAGRPPRLTSTTTTRRQGTREPDAPLFQFASGKTMQISAQAKARADAFINAMHNDDDDDDDDDDAYDGENDQPRSKNSLPSTEGEDMPMIQMASGKAAFAVSAASKARVANLFVGLDDDDDDDDDDDQDDQDNPPMISFASGRKPIVPASINNKSKQKNVTTASLDDIDTAPIPSETSVPTKAAPHGSNGNDGDDDEDSEEEFERTMAAARAKRMARAAADGQPSFTAPIQKKNPNTTATTKSTTGTADTGPQKRPAAASAAPPAGRVRAFKAPQQRMNPQLLAPSAPASSVTTAYSSQGDSDVSGAEIDPLDALADEMLLVRLAFLQYCSFDTKENSIESFMMVIMDRVRMLPRRP
jgi:hypothetical protein